KRVPRDVLGPEAHEIRIGALLSGGQNGERPDGSGQRSCTHGPTHGNLPVRVVYNATRAPRTEFLEPSVVRAEARRSGRHQRHSCARARRVLTGASRRRLQVAINWEERGGNWEERGGLIGVGTPKA